MAAATIILTVKDDGSATIQKVSSEMKKLHSDAQAGAKGSIDALNVMKGALGALGITASGAAMVGFIKDGIAQALEAEHAFTQLKFAVNAAAGDGFDRYSAAVQEATAKTASYAIVQDEVANKALQILVTNTGKLGDSMANLNLVFDLATAKNIDMASAAKIVSLAMEGNVSALKKQIPEFAELLDELDKHASTSEKSALAVQFLHDKVDGATGAMADHARSVKEMAKSWDDFKQGAGDAALSFFDFLATKASRLHPLLSVFGSLAAKMTESARVAELEAQAHTGGSVAKASAALAADELTRKEREQAAAAAALKAEMDHINESIRMNAEISDFDTAATLRRKAATDALTAALKEEENILKSRLAILADLDNAQQTSFLTRGSADDALSRIRQTVFSGPGQSAESLQGLLKTTSGLSGGNEDDKARLIRDLQEELRKVAGSDVAGVQQAQAARASGGSGAFSNVQSFSPNTGAYGLRQPIAVQPTIYIGGTQLVGFVDHEITPTQDRRDQQRGIE